MSNSSETSPGKGNALWMELMQARQIVGSQDGVKPREILLRPENVEAFFLGTGQGDVGQ